MNLIKLNAIDSTNDFLKALNVDNALENFTVVVAENQTKGKGQHGALWQVESGKNLTFSILIKNSVTNINQIFNLNAFIAIQIHDYLNDANIPNLSIKWPNDIMSANKKIGGILIENLISHDGSINSVIGIGLNVNQTFFGDLSRASSLYNVTNEIFDIDVILNGISQNIENNFHQIGSDEMFNIWSSYNKNLFKRDIPCTFKDQFDNYFMGIIKEVSKDGLLILSLEDNSIKSFEIKQIAMMY